MSEDHIILIPSTPAGMPVGSVFNNFFVISSATEALGDKAVWDFSNVFYIHPILSATLSLYKQFSSKKIEIINTNKEIDSYIRNIYFSEILDSLSFKESLINDYYRQNHIPILKFKADDDEMQQTIQEVIIKQSNSKELTTPLSYILGELVCNIVQHAETDMAYIFSQYEPKEDAIYLILADQGIGIYSSYVKANKYIAQIGDGDAEALRLANEGYSTKDLPEAENRGFGISTSRNMLVNGLRGAFYMMSGNALQLSLPNTDNTFIELPKNVEWQGTLIVLRIPRNIPRGFVYTDFLE